jgi:hypothetical protein
MPVVGRTESGTPTFRTAGFPGRLEPNASVRVPSGSLSMKAIHGGRAMKSPICAVLRRQTASFSIVTMIVAIALGFVAGNQPTSAQAPASSASSVVVTAPSSPGDWTQFLRANLERWNPYETVLGVNSVGNLQLKWTQSSKSTLASYTNPVVANGWYMSAAGTIRTSMPSPPPPARICGVSTPPVSVCGARQQWRTE